MATQLTLALPAALSGDASEQGASAFGETRVAVIPKPHIVDFVLNLAGYTSDRELGNFTLLDPSCSHEAFLISAVTRLLDSADRTGRLAPTLEGALLAFVEREHVDRVRNALFAVLHRHKIDKGAARRLVETWVQKENFLLATINRKFDFVIGTPPHVRTEQLSAELQVECRKRYPSLRHRADLYVAFIERGLSLLSPTGWLSFICADRWISNTYGTLLRELITTQYRLACYVNMHMASPFESDVIAYTSIFLLGQGKTKRVSVISLRAASAVECAGVTAALTGRGEAPEGTSITTYDTWFRDDEPWILSSPTQLRALRDLEARFPPIVATARIGIGVATGNDKVYIVKANVDIERDRLVPLVMRDDLDHGRIRAPKNTGDQTG
jgi:hypothetical protein